VVVGEGASGASKLVAKPFNRKSITAGFQDHHIISDKNSLTKNHELLELSKFDLQQQSNKIFLPETPELHPTRSIHSGRHLNSVSGNLAKQMDEAVAAGQQQNWAQSRYAEELHSILMKERKMLKSGERALNKNARPWAH